MTGQIQIHPLLKSDISHLTHLQPEDWNDIRNVFNQFIRFDFFYPVKALFQERIVGVGEVLFNKNTAWIGVIVVDKAFRNKGIGTLITDYLSKFIVSKNKSTQLLLATPLGQPVYQKLGFRHVSDYVFLKRNQEEKPLDFQAKHGCVKHYDHRFFEEMVTLDTLATGENRQAILKRFTTNCLLFVDRELQGFFMPHLGDGLIVAKTNEAGFELLKIKWSTYGETITLPAENLETIDFAQSLGFEPFRYAAKMILGKQIDWKPQMIYNRIGGYLG